MKKYPIGFLVRDGEKQTTKEVERSIKEVEEPRKSVVEIYFSTRNMTLSYYNDMFNLKVGDLVYVDGKLEGLGGRVVSVNYSFKIKLSEYKRVIAVIDTTLYGEFYLAGSHVVSFNEKIIPYEKVIRWFKAPNTDEEEFIEGNGENRFLLEDLGTMEISSQIADRGFNYYNENRVKYISIDKGKGKAIVEGSEIYELEFEYEYQNGEIINLNCSCFCSYPCKHQFAAMLQLRETLDMIENNYAHEYASYFAAISKNKYIEMALGKNDIGKIILEV
ncbi:MAG: hypothetical protein PHE51_07790 [Eubacteriales bacterium]|nr:hypothetical protein [Eubacteriales bacterium]